MFLVGAPQKKAWETLQGFPSVPASHAVMMGIWDPLPFISSICLLLPGWRRESQCRQPLIAVDSLFCPGGPNQLPMQGITRTAMRKKEELPAQNVVVVVFLVAIGFERCHN